MIEPVMMLSRTSAGRIVTVVVPAYNEAATIERNLTAISAFMDTLRPHYSWNMVVVDDGSSDGTAAIAKSFAEARTNVLALGHPANRGLAEALKTGFSNCNGDYVITIDSDLTYGVEHIGAMLSAIEATGAAIVTASPYMTGGRASGVPFVRRWLSILGNKFLSYAVHGRIGTLTCMVRAYDAVYLSKLIPENHARDFNAEIVFTALKRGAQVVEVPGHLNWSGHPKRNKARVDWRRVFRRVLATLRMGFENRPALWLAVPGIFPGLLPAVVAIFALCRASVPTIAIASAVTLTIQMLSIALISWQTAALLTGSTAPKAVVHSFRPMRSNDV
jgi:glycosyltransferase involved in cell wall biosynthesis